MVKKENSMVNRKFYSCSEVAKKLGLNEQAIGRMCEQGKFKGAKGSDDKEGHWLIPQENFITTNEQDEVADKILQTIDKKNMKAGDIDEFNL